MFPSRVQADAEVHLRLARDSDAPAIAEWTRAPEVHQFWGGRVSRVEEVLEKYTGRRAPEVVAYVVCLAGRPVGYVQAWQRDGRYGLDMFVASHAQGRGVGPRAARALAEQLTSAGRVPLTVDPEVDNVSGIEAWRRAGFRETEEITSRGGGVRQLMAFAPTP